MKTEHAFTRPDRVLPYDIAVYFSDASYGRERETVRVDAYSLDDALTQAAISLRCRPYLVESAGPACKD